jgi:hypothetical protein
MMMMMMMKKKKTLIITGTKGTIAEHSENT